MKRILSILNTPASAYTLAYFRIGLGILILFSTLRFLFLGWIDMQYLQPSFHFPYFGLEHFTAPSQPFVQLIFGILCISSIGVILGYHFRLMS
ncbi:MAG: HTTM domain-containing protein, partial [Candidatus Kapaibacteriota bacterium]